MGDGSSGQQREEENWGGMGMSDVAGARDHFVFLPRCVLGHRAWSWVNRVLILSPDLIRNWG